MMLTLPTIEQIFDAGCEDAGEFMMQLREDKDALAAFFASSKVPYGGRHEETVYRRVEHLCYYVARVIEGAVRPGKAFTGKLKNKDVAQFKRMRS